MNFNVSAGKNCEEHNCLTIYHKNFIMSHIFLSIYDKVIIFGMREPCDKPFQLQSFRDLALLMSCHPGNHSLSTCLLLCRHGSGEENVGSF